MDARELRVALFSGNYNYIPDGANQALNRLVGYLLRQGASVRIYSPTIDQPPFVATGEVVSVPSVPFPGRSEYRVPFCIPPSAKRDLKAFAPNVIHVASPEFMAHSAIRIAHKSKVPAIASVHTRFETYPRYYGLAVLEPLVEAILRRFYRRCDAIFAPSESMAQVLRDQRMSYDVGIWSRGIDHEIFTSERRDLAWRQSLGISDDDPVIGFVGRLVMEKGLDIFADTIDALDRRQVRNKVLIVGEGPAREWFERRLPGAIFVGFQKGEALGRAVASMDMLFNPSVTETFGNVTLEAMAANLPVVAARAPGSASLVRDGVTGRLIEPGRIQDFADALQSYIEREDLRAEAGREGHRASLSYGWDQVNQKLVDGYLRVIRQRRAGGGLPQSGNVP